MWVKDNGKIQQSKTNQYKAVWAARIEAMTSKMSEID